jgi:hypothetical protein
VGGDFIYHRNANGWSAFADDSWRALVPPPPTYLVRVRTAGPNDLWVLEQSHILHFDGSHWTAVEFVDPGFPNVPGSTRSIFTDLWIDGPNNVWVVGPSDTVGSTVPPAFLHQFDGSAWTHIPSGVFHPYALWQAGSVLWIAQPGNFGVTLRRYDGTTAETVGVPVAGAGPGGPSLTSLWGRSATDLWSAGDDVAHFDGQQWSLVPGIPDAARDGFAGTHVSGDGRAVWLSTPGPRFFRMPQTP